MSLFARIQTASNSLKNDWQTIRMAHQVANHAQRDQGRLPVVFFNASTRIRGHSQNAAFALLASWAVRLAGVRVIHFICWAGMSRCVLGTDQDAPEQAMPCKLCMRQSRVNTRAAEKRIFTWEPDDELAATLQKSASMNSSAMNSPCRRLADAPAGQTGPAFPALEVAPPDPHR